MEMRRIVQALNTLKVVDQLHEFLFQTACRFIVRANASKKYSTFTTFVVSPTERLTVIRNSRVNRRYARAPVNAIILIVST